VRAFSKPQSYVLEEEEQQCFKEEWWRQKHVSANAPDDTRYLKIFSTTQAWEKIIDFQSRHDTKQALQCILGIQSSQKLTQLA
jgi:hypothetical protein